MPLSVSGTLLKKLKPLNMLLLFSLRCPIVIPSATSKADLNLDQHSPCVSPGQTLRCNDRTFQCVQKDRRKIAGLHLIGSVVLSPVWDHNVHSLSAVCSDLQDITFLVRNCTALQTIKVLYAFSDQSHGVS